MTCPRASWLSRWMREADQPSPRFLLPYPQLVFNRLVFCIQRLNNWDGGINLFALYCSRDGLASFVCWDQASTIVIVANPCSGRRKWRGPSPFEGLTTRRLTSIPLPYKGVGRCVQAWTSFNAFVHALLISRVRSGPRHACPGYQ